MVVTFAHLVALLPAILSVVLLALVEGPRWAARIASDKVALDVVAEVAVHLSTYGAVVVGLALDMLFNLHLEHSKTMLLVGLVWFAALVRVSYIARRLAETLEEEHAEVHTSPGDGQGNGGRPL